MRFGRLAQEQFFVEVDLGKDLCFDSFPLLATDVSVCWLRAEN